MHTALCNEELQKVTDLLLQKGQWLAQKVGGSAAQYLSCKVFPDWSIISIQESIHIY